MRYCCSICWSIKVKGSSISPTDDFCLKIWKQVKNSALCRFSFERVTRKKSVSLPTTFVKPAANPESISKRLTHAGRLIWRCLPISIRERDWDRSGYANAFEYAV